MNLHLFNSRLFIANAWDEFNKTGEENEFVLINDEHLVKEFGTYKNLTVDELSAYIKTSKPKRVVIHYLDGQKAKAIIDSGYDGDIYWNAWGGDIYNPHFGIDQRNLLDEKSLAVYQNLHLHREKSLAYRVPRILRPLLLLANRIFKGQKHFYQYIEETLKKVDYCSTVIPSEFELVQSKIPSVQFCDFTYGNLQTFIPEHLRGFHASELGNRIIIGPSSSPAHNHLTAVETIGNDYEILVPLAYGNEAYKNVLIQQFDSKKNIELLKEMKPYDEYLELLTSCNTMVMIQKRQHALGNIIIGLYLGMRLYFDPANPTYKFLKDLGVNIFDFHQEFHQFKNKPLSEKEVNENRLSIQRYWGEEASIERMKSYFK